MRKHASSSGTSAGSAAGSASGSAAAELIAAVIGASNHFEALGLSLGQPLSKAEVRSAFRRRALLVHPDKCSNERSAEAFRLLSDALEEVEDEPERARLAASAAADGGRANKRRRGHDSGAARSRQSRSWAEWERELRRREELERAFKSFNSARYATRGAARTLRRVEKLVFELDEKAGVARHPLVPPDPWAPPDEADAAHGVLADPGSVARETSRHLLELLVYLRAHYCYCAFCGVRYDDDDDLDRSCPGVTEEAHEDDESGGGTGITDY
jgi:hypothetical protein